MKKAISMNAGLFATKKNKLNRVKLERPKIISLCKELNNFLKNRFEYKRNMASVTPLAGKTIYANCKKIDLYIRFDEHNIDEKTATTLSLARIFVQPRVGHGRALLEFLLSHAGQFGVTTIRIESTNQDSAAFAKRFGFSDQGYGNWSINIEVLGRSGFTPFPRTLS